MTVETQATSVALAVSQSGTPPARPLLIRVEISSKGPPRDPVRRRLSRAALLLLLGAVAVLLSWVGIGVFRTEPTPAPAASEGAAPSSASQSPAPVPASEARKQPDASPSPVSEVIPDVPRSARETIRGTVRVSVRVIVDKEGKVLVATADDPGPSRYCEQLAIKASKKWRFAPADSQGQRIMLVRFNFTRARTTARASAETAGP